MPKHIINLPPPPPPPPSPPPPLSAPRLVVQLFVAMGELLAIGVCIIGLITVANWLTRPVAAPVEQSARRAPPLICAIDRRGVEWCRRPEDRFSPRRHYVSD
jgi:hypothetical protein